MEKRQVSGITLTLLLVGMITFAFNIEPVKAGGTIYIKADGSVDPSTAPISRLDNFIYTFTDNITDSIVVEIDNIVVDGAGYTLQGTHPHPPGGETGINVTERNNVTIKNLEIRAFKFGIYLWHSEGHSIVGNNITANTYDGISLDGSSYCSISGNNITNNNNGILFDKSLYNTISENTITNSNSGIWLESSANNNIFGNTIKNTTFEGISLGDSSNCSIKGNNIANNGEGIWLDRSSYSDISGNNITNNGEGIWLYSSYCSISGNIVADNGKGIWLESSANNNIFGNTIKNTTFEGILLSLSSDNVIVHNNLINNTGQVYSYQCVNVWDDGYPSGGNYWSDYEEKHPDAEEIDDSGIWNTPYVIDQNNKDNYPLMSPWEDVTPPVADAGTDQTVTEGTTVTFDGSKSTDDEGIKSYVWTFADVVPKTLIGVHPTNTFNNLGNFEVTLNVSDYAGNWNTDTMWVHVLPDTILPAITVLSPENTTYASSSVALTFKMSESTSWIGYSLDSQANITITGNTTLSGLSDDSHSLVVYAKDNTGNIGASEIIYFSIETPSPLPELFPTGIVAAIAIIAAFGTAVYLLKIRKKAEATTTTTTTKNNRFLCFSTLYIYLCSEPTEKV